MLSWGKLLGLGAVDVALFFSRTLAAKSREHSGTVSNALWVDFLLGVASDRTDRGHGGSRSRFAADGRVRIAAARSPRAVGTIEQERSDSGTASLRRAGVRTQSSREYRSQAVCLVTPRASPICVQLWPASRARCTDSRVSLSIAVDTRQASRSPSSGSLSQLPAARTRMFFA